MKKIAAISGLLGTGSIVIRRICILILGILYPAVYSMNWAATPDSADDLRVRIQAIFCLVIMLMAFVWEYFLVKKRKTKLWIGLKAAELFTSLIVVLVTYFNKSNDDNIFHFEYVLNFIKFNHLANSVAYYSYIASLIFGIIGVVFIAISIVSQLVSRKCQMVKSI